MSASAGFLDMLGLLERAALAGGSTTARAAVYVEAAEMARSRGLATCETQSDLSVVVTLAEQGDAFLVGCYGEGWLGQVRRELGLC